MRCWRPDDAGRGPVRHRTGRLTRFRTLALQQRLTALAAEIDALSADADRVYARGARLRVATAAYDDVLADACVLAGLPVQRDGSTRREVARLLEEVELRSAGWSW